MKLLVTGASGYLGGRLVPELLKHGHQVSCFVRSPDKLRDLPWRDDVEIVKGDLGDRAALERAFDEIDVAYYLVHSMGDAGRHRFGDRDRDLAANFRDAADFKGVRRLVYLGGLGRDDDDLSLHLRSRHDVGKVLAEGNALVTELRAAVIIGSGSASFEMLRHLVEVLPVMVTPRWVRTRCQPIAIEDVLHYLCAVLETPETEGRIIEIGGPDQLTYQQMMQVYAERAGLHRRILLSVPLLTPQLSSHWIGLVTPLPTLIAKPLVEGLANEVLVNDAFAEATMPHTRLSFADAIDVAIRHTKDLEVTTSWAGAEVGWRSPADPLPSDPDWSGGTVLHDTREMTIQDTSSVAVYRAVCGIGGQKGWLVADRLWSIRGWIDKLLGGVGMRRGRRHPEQLRLGDPLDFWRVEALVPDTLLRLRAEMRLPGRAWLEWSISDDEQSDGTVHLVQRALFQPRGLWGRLYWYSLSPFHGIIFKGLANALANGAVGASPTEILRRSSTGRLLRDRVRFSTLRRSCRQARR